MPLFTIVRKLTVNEIREYSPQDIHCCNDTCSSMATHKVSGEEDSFGVEWMFYCEAHAEEARENGDTPFEGCCSWCKKQKDDLLRHRDFEEGSHGPVYDVCDECREKEAKAIQKELAEAYPYDYGD